MTDDNDNTSKLIILVAGLSTIVFFAYLIYKDNNKSNFPPLTLARRKSTELEKIEHRLTQLETKLDSLSTITKLQPQPQLQPQSQLERTVVSMNKPKQANTITKMKNTNTREMFDMR